MERRQVMNKEILSLTLAGMITLLAIMGSATMLGIVLEVIL